MDVEIRLPIFPWIVLLVPQDNQVLLLRFFLHFYLHLTRIIWHLQPYMRMLLITILTLTDQYATITKVIKVIQRSAKRSQTPWTLFRPKPLLTLHLRLRLNIWWILVFPLWCLMRQLQMEMYIPILPSPYLLVAWLMVLQIWNWLLHMLPLQMAEPTRNLFYTQKS